MTDPRYPDGARVECREDQSRQVRQSLIGLIESEPGSNLLF
jgi:hypothetical protein